MPLEVLLDEGDQLLSTKFEKAFHFAHHFHRDQIRKGTTIPYISHLMSVSSTVLECGGTEQEAIAALLHDIIEDHGPEYSNGGSTGLANVIAERFGQEVLDIVLECTDSLARPKPPWRERKEKHINHLKTASKGGTLVNMADKLHNAKAIIRDHELTGDEMWERFKGKKEGTKWYYSEIVKALKKNKEANLSLLDRLEKEATVLQDL